MAANLSTRQTLTYLRDLFEARGLRPKSKLGQSFLIDLNIVDVIVRSAELGPKDLVLEIGSGTGGLTARVADEAGAVLGVELDAGFYELARDHTAGFGNVTLLHCDALKNKNQLNPLVLETLESLQRERGLDQIKLVANLPYAVAVPVIGNLLVQGVPLERMVVMIQWELAERAMARPSTKDYGGFSIIVQSLADVTLLRRIPPRAFWPRPKVESALIGIRPDAGKRARVGDVQSFRNFLRELYVHRRKNLRGALLPTYRDRFTKPQLDERLTTHGFDPRGRAEALTVEEHVRLCEVMNLSANTQA